METFRDLLERLDQLRSTGILVEYQDPYGNELGDWATALAIALVALIVLRILKSIVYRRAKALTERRPEEIFQTVVTLVSKTKLWFLIIVALYLSSLALDFPRDDKKTDIRDVIQSVVVVSLLLQGAIWGNALLNFAVERYSKQRMEIDAAGVTTVSALGFLGKLALWTVVLLLALENVGVDVTALIAGLGIGGIAVALAAQNVLGDLFGSFSIVLDKPFVLGDFIAVGTDVGTIEHIGLKTTRVRSLSGEQLVFSNNDLLQSRIRNFKRMWERRVVFKIGVTYQTPHEKLVAIPDMIRQIIESQEQTRFDRAHFQTYGDFALIFEIVYFVLSPQYNVYMDIHQAINLAIYQRFAAEGIEFAYPTQTLYVQKTEP